MLKAATYLLFYFLNCNNHRNNYRYYNNHRNGRTVINVPEYIKTKPKKILKIINKLPVNIKSIF